MSIDDAIRAMGVSLDSPLQAAWVVHARDVLRRFADTATLAEREACAKQLLAAAAQKRTAVAAGKLTDDEQRWCYDSVSAALRCAVKALETEAQIIQARAAAIRARSDQ